MKIGIDAVEIARMEKNLQNEAFTGRVFTEEERTYFAGRKHPAESAAANFAAREALAKALGCGIFGFDLKEAAVLRRESGAPYFSFTGKLAEKMAAEGLSAEVSLTHEGGLAAAVVLLQP